MKRSKSQWRTRTRGSKRQIGSKFMLPTTSRQKLASQLPTVTGRPKGSLKVTTQPSGSQSARVVRLSLVKVKTNELIPREKHPVDVERRAQYFVDMYRRGETIPPVLVHKMKNGRYLLMDGHARILAYKQLGITEIPAIENGILQSLGKGARAVGKAVTSGAHVAKKAVKYGERVASYGYRTAGKALTATQELAGQVGAVSRAYQGEAPADELAHQEKMETLRAQRVERLAEIRAKREAPIKNVPFGGSSSPLMQREIRKTRWRVRGRKLQEGVKKRFDTVKEWAQQTPELYRLKKKNNPSYVGSQLSQVD